MGVVALLKRAKRAIRTKNQRANSEPYFAHSYPFTGKASVLIQIYTQSVNKKFQVAFWCEYIISAVGTKLAELTSLVVKLNGIYFQNAVFTRSFCKIETRKIRNTILFYKNSLQNFVLLIPYIFSLEYESAVFVHMSTQDPTSGGDLGGGGGRRVSLRFPAPPFLIGVQLSGGSSALWNLKQRGK